MDCNKVIQLIARGRIIAILRGDFGGLEEEIASTLADSGVTAMEVTLNSPGAIDSINRLAKVFGNRIAIGAGTVLRATEVALVAEAGASFIVSPNRDLGVIEATKRSGLVSLPGCFTPSEMVEALQAGADAIKVFPASSLGPPFIKSLRGPLSDIRLVPTGGVTLVSIGDYFDAGAWAVGTGSELVGSYVLESNGLDLLRGRAAAFVAAARPKE
jgi:Entner-Doudoroff aldolase